MRRVRLIVEYDMDDEDKSLEAERQDWLREDVTIADIVACDGEDSVRIELVP